MTNLPLADGKPKKAYTLEFAECKISLWGGGASKGGGWKKNEAEPEMVLSAVDLGSEFKVGKGLGPEWAVKFDWPDFQKPKWTRQEWDDLILFMVENKVKNVHCQCMAGHGRTGTMLAIIFQVSTNIHNNVADLVLDIRGRYDPEAVESKSQFDYISTICGIPLGDYKTLVKEPLISTVWTGNNSEWTKNNSTEFTEFDKKHTTRFDIDTAKKVFEAWICAEKPKVVDDMGIKFLNVDSILVNPTAVVEMDDLGMCKMVRWEDIDTTFYPKSNKKMIDQGDLWMQ